MLFSEQEILAAVRTVRSKAPTPRTCPLADIGLSVSKETDCPTQGVIKEHAEPSKANVFANRASSIVNTT